MKRRVGVWGGRLNCKKYVNESVASSNIKRNKKTHIVYIKKEKETKRHATNDASGEVKFAVAFVC